MPHKNLQQSLERQARLPVIVISMAKNDQGRRAVNGVRRQMEAQATGADADTGSRTFENESRASEAIRSTHRKRGPEQSGPLFVLRARGIGQGENDKTKMNAGKKMAPKISL